MHVITRNDKMSGISTVVYTEPHCIYNILADYKISCAIVSYNSSLISSSRYHIYSIRKTHLSNNSYVEYKYCAFSAMQQPMRIIGWDKVIVKYFSLNIPTSTSKLSISFPFFFFFFFRKGEIFETFRRATLRFDPVNTFSFLLNSHNLHFHNILRKRI